jgi:hypothetical protein
MRNQSLVLHLLAAASLVSLAACGSSEQAALDRGYYGSNGADQTVNALGTSNVAVYSNPAYREEARGAPNDEGFSGSSQPSSAPAAPWTGTENWPAGANGPVPPGAPSNGSDMGQFGS